MAMSAVRSSPRGDTAIEILDVAERLVQQRGYNGFSYADVAAELGITKAALHYHFPGKAELGVALLERYAAAFVEALENIDLAHGSAPKKLRGYVGLYANVLRGDRMCLCGMLAAEFQTLPDPMQKAVIRFFDQNEKWLAGVLEDGRNGGTLEFHQSPRQLARVLIGGLEGAMLLARPYQDVRRFDAVVSLMIDPLVTIAGTRRGQNS
jgi:TetR/AcrR family transcriptional regulator, transcriptional repressor for nem operon